MSSYTVGGRKEKTEKVCWATSNKPDSAFWYQITPPHTCSHILRYQHSSSSTSVLYDCTSLLSCAVGRTRKMMRRLVGQHQAHQTLPYSITTFTHSHTCTNLDGRGTAMSSSSSSLWDVYGVLHMYSYWQGYSYVFLFFISVRCVWCITHVQWLAGVQLCLPLLHLCEMCMVYYTCTVTGRGTAMSSSSSSLWDVCGVLHMYSYWQQENNRGEWWISVKWARLLSHITTLTHSHTHTCMLFGTSTAVFLFFVFVYLYNCTYVLSCAVAGSGKTTWECGGSVSNKPYISLCHNTCTLL